LAHEYFNRHTREGREPKRLVRAGIFEQSPSLYRSVSLSSAFRSADVELFPTAKGEFRAELTQTSIGKLWIHGAHENLPRVYVGAVRPHRAAIGFLTEPNQPAMQHCGMEVLPGDIIVNNADMMHRRTAANCDWGSMSLPPDDLNAACKAITGHEFSNTSLRHLVRPSPDLMSGLLRLHGMVGQIAKTTPNLLELPEGGSSAGTGIDPRDDQVPD